MKRVMWIAVSVFCVAGGLGCGTEPGEGGSKAQADAPAAEEPELPPSDEEKTEIARALEFIEEKKDPDAQDSETKQTWLFKAADNGYLHLARKLLERKADVNALSGNGFSPLHIAAFRGEAKIAALLLDRGAESDRPCGEKNPLTPLHEAALGGSPKIMRMLLDKKADSARRGGNNRSLLHMAAEGGDVEAVKIALDLGLKVDDRDDDGWTPLHSAAYANATDVIDLLSARGADLEAKNKKLQTPLHAAAFAEKREYISLVIEEPDKAPVTKDLRTKKARAAKPPELQVIADTGKAGGGEFKEVKLTEDQIDRMGQVMTSRQQSRESDFGPWSTKTYQYATLNGAAAVRRLLAKGAAVNVKDESGKTALDFANEAYSGERARVAEILRAHGGKPGGEVP